MENANVNVNASRAIELPLALTMARVSAPRDLARRMAARESAVSPDWEMMMTRSPSPTSGSL